jgi:hypothetical protein
VLACTAALGSAMRCVRIGFCDLVSICFLTRFVAGSARGTIAAAVGAVWGCHFGLRTVPVPQYDALQGRARLLAVADDLLRSAAAFGPADAWLMPQIIQAAQLLEQDAAAALQSESADFKALLEGIAKRSVELDALNGLEDVERAGEAAALFGTLACNSPHTNYAEKKRLLSSFYSLESQLQAKQARL